ncbi:MAG: hypothetical protein JSR36_00900 [Proteobacteria bacterium]|nr:hypothetical protein [Pseudomonadota bacterium]
MGDLFSSFWSDFIERLDGPLHFRFVVQPMIAVLLAVRDGRRDARAGRSAFLWKFASKPEHRGVLVKSAAQGISKVFAIALVLDFAYQWIEWGSLKPLQAVATAALLAVVPYVLLRGPANRLVSIGGTPKAAGSGPSPPGKEGPT